MFKMILTTIIVLVATVCALSFDRADCMQNIHVLAENGARPAPHADNSGNDTHTNAPHSNESGHMPSSLTKSSPIYFTKNIGQWDERVLFRSRSNGITMWFTKDGITYHYLKNVDPPVEGVGNDAGGSVPLLNHRTNVGSVDQMSVAARFVNCNPDPEVVFDEQTEYRCNYFIGNDPSKWRTDIPSYERVTLKNVYPDIDVSCFDSNGEIACVFVVSQRANASLIEVAYEGATGVSTCRQGRLVLHTKWGGMTAGLGPQESSPNWTIQAPMITGSDPRGVSEVKADRQGLEEIGLSYSTYLGGSSYDYGYAVAVNRTGNAFITGETFSADFPTSGEIQSDEGSYDVFVAKLSSAGNALIFGTYVGGQARDLGSDIAVDDDGNVYCTGRTSSSDFPTVAPYQTDQGNDDAFVFKLSSSGSSLVYATYLGGGGADEAASIALDYAGCVYVVGQTESFAFPVMSPFQTDQGAYDCDGFLTKFSGMGNTLIYSTYLGGSGYDAAFGVAVDLSGCAYVTGWTSSSDFPTLNPYQAVPIGTDAFVTKFSTQGSNIIYSTYLGGEREDNGNDIAVDASGRAYVTGSTWSTGFPVQNPFQTYQGGDPWGSDAFVTKLNIIGNGLEYSTYLGGASGDWGHGIAINGAGNAVVIGRTASPDFPIAKPFQYTIQSYDAFSIELSRNGASLVYATFLGGTGDEEASAVVVDSDGNVYVVGETNSTDFPLRDPVQSYQGVYDAFVTKLAGVYPCTSCGDANSDGDIDISDAVFLISHIFTGGAAPASCDYPKGKGDANGDQSVDISDAVYLIARIFTGGPAPHCYGL